MPDKFRVWVLIFLGVIYSGISIGQSFSDLNNYGILSVKGSTALYFNGFYNYSNGSLLFSGTNGEIHVKGNWQNNGSNSIGIGTTNGTVIFEGTALQTISYSANITEFSNFSVSSGATVQVPAGKFITIKGNYSDYGQFILKSDSNGNASLLDGNVFGSVTNTGNIKVERFVAENSLKPFYHFLSSPLAGSAYDAIWDYNLGNYWVLWYDETIINGDINMGWKRFFQWDEPYIPGRGYSAIYNATTTRIFEGQLNTNSDISISVNWNETPTPWKSGDPRGWALLGNPYPSSLSASAFLDENSDGTPTHPLTGTLYFWDDENGDTSTANDYASWNKTGGIGNAGAGHPGYSPNGNIAVGQGFFVQYDKNLGSGNSRTSDIYFKNNMRLHQSGSQFFIPDNFSNPKLILAVTADNKNYNEILIGFMKNASWSYDYMYDGLKLKGNPHIALYTDMPDGQFGITALPLPTLTDVIPVGLDANDGGNYVFNAKTIENFSGMDVILEDRALKIYTDLSNGSDYKVSLQAGIFKNRFYIRFEKSTSVPDENRTALKIYVNGENIIVSGDNSFQPTTRVIVSDMAGKQFYQGKFEGNTMSIPAGNFKGYCLISLLTGNISQTRLIFIP